MSVNRVDSKLFLFTKTGFVSSLVALICLTYSSPIYSTSTLNSNLQNNIQLWLDASDPSTITSDEPGAVSEWRDMSGNGNHAFKTGSDQPKILPDSKINNANVMQFKYLDYFSIPELKGYAEGELYIVVRVDTDNVHYGGFHDWGNSSNQHYAYTGAVYENFGRNVRLNFSPDIDFTEYVVYHVLSSPTAFQLELIIY